MSLNTVDLKARRIQDRLLELAHNNNEGEIKHDAIDVKLEQIQGELVATILSIHTLEQARHYKDTIKPYFIKQCHALGESNQVYDFIQTRLPLIETVLEHRIRISLFSRNRRSGYVVEPQVQTDEKVVSNNEAAVRVVDSMSAEGIDMLVALVSKINHAQSLSELTQMSGEIIADINDGQYYRTGNTKAPMDAASYIADIYKVREEYLRLTSGNQPEQRYIQLSSQEGATVAEVKQMEEYSKKIEKSFNYLRSCLKRNRPTRFIAKWTVYSANWIRNISWMRKAQENCFDFWERRTGRLNGDPLDSRLVSEAAAFPWEGDIQGFMEGGKPVYDDADILPAAVHGALYQKLIILEQKRMNGAQIWYDDLKISVTLMLDQNMRQDVEVDLFDIFTSEKNTWDNKLQMLCSSMLTDASKFKHIQMSQEDRVRLRGESYSKDRADISDKSAEKYARYQQFFGIAPGSPYRKPGIIIHLNRSERGHNQHIHDPDSLFITDSSEMAIDIDALTGKFVMKYNHTLWDGFTSRGGVETTINKMWGQIPAYQAMKPLDSEVIVSRLPPREVSQRHETDRSQTGYPLTEVLHSQDMQMPIKKIIIRKNGREYKCSPTMLAGLATAISNDIPYFHQLVNATGPDAKKPSDPRWNNIQPVLTTTDYFFDTTISPEEFFHKVFDLQDETARCKNGESTAAVLAAPLGDAEPELKPVTLLVDEAAKLLLRARGMFSPVPVMEKNSGAAELKAFYTARADVYTLNVDLNKPETGMGVVGYNWEPGKQPTLSVRLEPADAQVAFAGIIDAWGGRTTDLKLLERIIAGWQAYAQGKKTYDEYRHILEYNYELLKRRILHGDITKMQSADDLQLYLNSVLERESRKRLNPDPHTGIPGIVDQVIGRFRRNGELAGAQISESSKVLIIDFDRNKQYTA